MENPAIVLVETFSFKNSRTKIFPDYVFAKFVSRISCETLPENSNDKPFQEL